MKTRKGIIVRNPLSDKRITQYDRWTPWLERWYMCTDKRELISMLHVGFSLGTNQFPGTTLERCEETNQFLFYLNLADGWRDGIHQGFTSDRGTFSREACPLRTEISQKAFDMLCIYPFKKWVEFGERAYGLEELYTSQSLLPILMHFFSEYHEDGTLSVHNIGYSSQKSHNCQYAEKFLFCLIDAIWSWKKNTFVDSLRSSDEQDTKRVQDEEKKKRLDEAKLWTIEILNSLRRLDRLKHIKILGESAELKLLEIALRSSIDSPHVKIYRQVRNLDEALKSGDSAAWFLHKYRMTRVPKAVQRKKNRKRKSIPLI